MKLFTSLFVGSLALGTAFTAVLAEDVSAANAEQAAYKNFGEAMDAGSAFYKVGRENEIATYRARAKKDWTTEKKTVALWQSNFEKAFAAYQAAVKMAPNDDMKARALKEGARSGFTVRKLQADAIQMMKQAYELKKDNGEYVYQYTWMLACSNNHEECCKVAEAFYADKNYKKPYADHIYTDNYLNALLKLKRFADAKAVNEAIKAVSPKADRIAQIEKAEQAVAK